MANLSRRIEELKEHLLRIEQRIDTVYSDMGYIRENMANSGDLNIMRDVMATSKEVDRLWKFNWIYLAAIIGLLSTLLFFLLT